MRIKDDDFNIEARAETLISLKNLLSQPSDQMERPCPGCRFATPDGRTDSESTKFCSYSCPAAPTEMSGDPARYPIELGVVPAVYAFYTLRKLMPCWSCEGHLDGNGKLSKLPKVWFYSTSSFYAKLVSQAICQMEAEKHLINGWGIRILPFSQSMYTITYSLEPLTLAKQRSDLDSLTSLQADLKAIADHLRSEVFKQAQDYVHKDSSSPFNKR